MKSKPKREAWSGAWLLELALIIAVALGLAQQLSTTRIKVNIVWSYVVGRAAAKKKN